MSADLTAWADYERTNRRARWAYRADTTCPRCGSEKASSARALCDDCSAADKRRRNRLTKRRKKS